MSPVTCTVGGVSDEVEKSPVSAAKISLSSLSLAMSILGNIERSFDDLCRAGSKQGSMDEVPETIFPLSFFFFFFAPKIAEIRSM